MILVAEIIREDGVLAELGWEESLAPLGKDL
jgi:hypothetical protein